jgi:hypothetical protein
LFTRVGEYKSANLHLPRSFCLLRARFRPAGAVTEPAAYLTFDEGAATVAHDWSGNNHNATLQCGVGWTAGLVGSNALSLVISH